MQHTLHFDKCNKNGYGMCMDIKHALLIHYGEIGLKGKNQADFLRRLQRNISSSLNEIGINAPVVSRRGYYSVDVSDQSEDMINAITSVLSITPGISWFCVAQQTARQDMEKAVLEMARLTYKPKNTFVVRVNRSDKSFPKTSSELERDLGAIIIEKTDWKNVSLKNADQTFYVEIYEKHTYIHTRKYRGIGGLPVGSSGRVLSLLSGGIDSPVASFLMAKRGCSVDFIHFTATTMQHKEAKNYKVSKLVEKLSGTTLNSSLYLVPYTNYHMATMEHDIDYDLVMFRRFMVRTARSLALEYQYEALVTGDNLAQVASQTLPNIVSTDKATDLPILRPLLGYDKNEIIDLAKKINTYELSIEPYKDCCSIISQNPKTRSDHDKLQEIETDVFDDYQDLIKRTLEDMTPLRYKNGKLID